MSAARHCECFSGGSLAVTHHRAVDAVDDCGDGLLAAVFKDVFLAGVVHQLVELELPCFCLIVYVTSMLILRDLNCHSLQEFD